MPRSPASDTFPCHRRQVLQRLLGGTLAAAAGLNLRLGAAEPDAVKRPPRLQRDNLLIYRDRDGQLQPVRTVDDWQHRRAEILAAMQEVMGPLPGKEKRVDLQLRTERETDDGSYLHRVISFTTEPDSRLSAYLLIPKAALQPGAKPFPAILAPLGTGMSARAFSREALERDGLPHFNGPNYARRMAERGFVVLVPPYPILGSYNPDLKALGYQSGTMKAIWDNIRSLDVLESLPFVQRGRFGTVGHSLGGHNSVYTAVFDERLQVVVSSCGLDSYVDYMEGDIRGWAQERYMPRIAQYPLAEIPFDFHEMIAALAPRVCFINAPKNDSNFRWKSAAAVAEAARQIYTLYKVPDHLRIEHPDAGHDFPDPMQELAGQLFDKHLR